VRHERDSRFRDVEDDERDEALAGDARPGDRILFHFRYVMYGGAVIGPAALAQVGSAVTCRIIIKES
jgi:hypothetical protein